MTCGCSGSSYGSLTPVNCGISPASAFAYRPLTSRRESSPMEHRTYTSTNRGTLARTSSRTARYGEIAATMATPPERAMRPATYPRRRTLVSRSSLEKPSPALRFFRTSSPSRISTLRPAATSSCLRRCASVDFPAPESPVNHTTNPWLMQLPPHQGRSTSADRIPCPGRAPTTSGLPVGPHRDGSLACRASSRSK